MAILIEDPSENVLVRLGDRYYVKVTKTVGGMCPNTAKQHMEDLMVIPDVPFETFAELAVDIASKEAEYYRNLWYAGIEDIPILHSRWSYTFDGAWMISVFTLWNEVDEDDVKDIWLRYYIRKERQ